MSAARMDTTTSLGEVWMKLLDRRRLAKLMLIQDVSQRQLAEAAGWKAHSYLGRLLRGEVQTLEVEPAARIAKYLGVGVDDLFVVEVTKDRGQCDPRRRSRAA